MHVQIIGPRLLAASQALNANWTSPTLRVGSVSHCALIFEGTTTASTSQFVIEVRIGNGVDVPFSSWQPLTLASALTLANAAFNQVVILTDLSFSELRTRLIADVGSNGSFSVWAQARGMH